MMTLVGHGCTLPRPCATLLYDGGVQSVWKGSGVQVVRGGFTCPNRTASAQT